MSEHGVKSTLLVQDRKEAHLALDSLLDFAEQSLDSLSGTLSVSFEPEMFMEVRHKEQKEIDTI
jgi:hypothetical protein